jgi:hypothetical protein
MLKYAILLSYSDFLVIPLPASSASRQHAYIMPSLNFNPDKEIPDLTGKAIFITGGM